MGASQNDIKSFCDALKTLHCHVSIFLIHINIQVTKYGPQDQTALNLKFIKKSK